jgi:transglutaminase-like putative cysteine protease
MSTGEPKHPRDVAAIMERYFQISLFLLIATGFATLMGTNRLDFLSVVFVCVALTLRGYLLLKNREFKIPEKWTTYFTLLYALVFVVDLFVISGSYVTASVHLVLFSLVVKIFSIQRERDYVYLSLLAFLAVLAASVLTVDTLFLGSFFIFILLAVNTFISMEVRRSLKQAVHSGQPPALARGDRQFPISLSLFSVLTVLGIIVGSAGLFFLLPRFSAGYLSSFSPQNELVTGFGDQVKLGEIGRIKQMDTVVMHVQTDSTNAFNLKWRGVALTVFDGKVWTNQANEQEVITSFAGRYSLRPAEMRRRNLTPPPQDPHEFRLVRYRVVMEPIGTNVLFLPSTPVELAGRFREINIDETGSILNADRNRMTESYEAVSQIPTVALARLESQSGNYPADVAMMYLQLPALDPRVHDLALKVTGDASTDYDKAAAIEQYLRENYGYTLNLGTIAPSDPITYFLFERKQGHCEYFASSMAVMLRSIGIPSRIVNGFRMGEYNDLTGNYIIRARDAHTWVEAFIPSVGWMSFDPTPPDPSPVVNTFSRMRLYLDAAQEFWREWVINYDFGHQRELTVTTVSKVQRTAFDFGRWWHKKYNALLRKAQGINDRVSNNPRRAVVVVLFALALLIVVWNLRLILRALRQRSIARKPTKAPQLAATIWYSRMLKTVARKGYPRQQTQTPSEFVKAISEASLRESVSKFTERYERARFGQSAQDAEKLPELYEEIAGKK